MALSTAMTSTEQQQSMMMMMMMMIQREYQKNSSPQLNSSTRPCAPTGFALVRRVTRHTFGLVQSQLFPVYFYCLLGANLCSLAVHAAHHTRELLDWHERVQLRAVEEEHSLGNQVGLGSQKEGYAKLREQDPKYRAFKRRFGRYHGLSSLANLVGFVCTTANLGNWM
ncbi:hypothetical protein CRUP_011354 [Coryphaenoides rupestris]|nr:hypothetical protein CRUP_011354 [Coryphaenoides rupestris]